jgi:hypothetical protein
MSYFQGGLLYYPGASDEASLNPAMNAAMLMSRYAQIASTTEKKNAYQVRQWLHLFRPETFIVPADFFTTTNELLPRKQPNVRYRIFYHLFIFSMTHLLV